MLSPDERLVRREQGFPLASYLPLQTDVILRSALAPLDPVSVPNGIVILNPHPEFLELGPAERRLLWWKADCRFAVRLNRMEWNGSDRQIVSLKPKRTVQSGLATRVREHHFGVDSVGPTNCDARRWEHDRQRLQQERSQRRHPRSWWPSPQDVRSS
jgi:hypothetical protein